MKCFLTVRIAQNNCLSLIIIHSASRAETSFYAALGFEYPWAQTVDRAYVAKITVCCDDVAISDLITCLIIIL